jgi:hypothetical protein
MESLGVLLVTIACDMAFSFRGAAGQDSRWRLLTHTLCRPHPQAGKDVKNQGIGDHASITTDCNAVKCDGAVVFGGDGRRGEPTLHLADKGLDSSRRLASVQLAQRAGKSPRRLQ